MYLLLMRDKRIKKGLYFIWQRANVAIRSLKYFLEQKCKMQMMLERLIPERGVMGNTFEAILNYYQSTVAWWVIILIFESYGNSYDGYY